MPKQSPSTSEYRKVLTRILNAAQENSDLWNLAYIPGALPVFSIRPDEQENDEVYYGITKDGKDRLTFCYEEGILDNPLIKRKGTPISIKSLVEDVQNVNMSPEYLRSSFLAAIKDPLRKFETTIARIDQKVQKKLEELEQALTA